MKMLDMVWKRLQRRKGKALFVLLGLLVVAGVELYALAL